MWSVANRPGVPVVVSAAALVGGIEAVEEFFPLALSDWGIPTAHVPLADLPIVTAGVVGAVLAGRVVRLRPGGLGGLLGGAATLFGAAGVLGHPAGVVGVALFYGGCRAVLVVIDARMQDRIDSRSRATVTSVAGLGTEVATLALYAAWAVGEVSGAALFALLVAALLPLLLRPACAGGVSAGR